MKLARLGPVGREIPVALVGDDVVDLRGIVDDLDGGSLAPDALATIRSAVEAGDLPRVDPTGLRVGAPVARPQSVLCIGLNYAEHAAESNAPIPQQPVLFLKTPNTIGGPFDDVRIPTGSTRTDWEVELGIVIGTAAYELVSPADARAHIAGFVLANDVSEREFQLELSGGQWSKGKCAPGFTPLGPWLVTPDEFDPAAVRLRSRVNGEPRQDSSTADMIFDVDTIVWHLSRFLRLEPGDVIVTGTPQGVALSGRFPYLRAGDVVEVEIDGLGAQRQLFV